MTARELFKEANVTIKREVLPMVNAAECYKYIGVMSKSEFYSVIQILKKLRC